MKKVSFLLIAILLLMVFAGCKGETDRPRQKGNITIYRVASPDEGLTALQVKINVPAWKKFMDTRSTINNTDVKEICFNIGVKIANATFCVYLNDFETAKKIAASVKAAATKVNIKSDKIEQALKELDAAHRIQDANVRSRKVRVALNILEQRIVGALQDTGSADYAALIQAGSWIETMKQLSGVIADKYTKDSANLLKSGEAGKHFFPMFFHLHKKKPTPIYLAVATAAKKIADLVAPREISLKAAQEIYAVSKALVDSLVK